MPGLRDHVRPAVRGAAVALLLLACAAAAVPQEKKGATVYLVLRVGPKITEQEILGTLKKGLELSNSTIDGEPTISPVSPSFFEEFQKLEGRAAPVAAADDPVRLLPTTETTYEIRVGPAQVLKKLKVKYTKGGEKEYVPAAPDAKSQLVLIVPGRYAFAPDKGDAPLTYEAEVAELGKANVPAVKGEWPKGGVDKYFVVTMRNFRGDRDVLFRVIQDPTKVANPLENIQLGNDLVFAFASLESSAPLPGIGGLSPNGEMTLSVETISNRYPKRVWVLFPLDGPGAQRELPTYAKLSSEELPKEIRKNAVVDVANNVAPVKAGDGPKWIELSPETPKGGDKPTRFSRKLQVDNVPAFMEKHPQLWYLVVWEFDNGTPEAIQVTHPDPKRDMAKVRVLEREHPGWQDAVKNAPKK